MSLAQEKVDTEKLYKEIAGDYAFEYQGQTMVFVVTMDEGKITKCTVNVPAMGIEVEGVRIKG